MEIQQGQPRAKIAIFTKSRYILRLLDFTQKFDIDVKFFTIYDNFTYDFDIIISYCYGRKLTKDILDSAKIKLNFHPAPLPEYPGADPYTKAVEYKVISWACTCHHMTEEYDLGPIYKRLDFPLYWPPYSREEIGALAHYFNYKLFMQVFEELINVTKDQIRSSS